jgi:hypothetical protein
MAYKALSPVEDLETEDSNVSRACTVYKQDMLPTAFNISILSRAPFPFRGIPFPIPCTFNFSFE